MESQPFRIAVPPDDVADLHRRIDATRWPDQLAGAGWAYGTDESYLRELVRHWRSDFSWAAVEAEWNAREQVLVEVDGTAIHAVRVPGVGPRPLPLVLTHGWPSSFLEFGHVLGPLADPGAHGGDPADAFDVVVPSLPGYGFSARPTAPGMTPRRIAALFGGLMTELGYDTFGAHGGDWGAYVTALLGLDVPERLTGIHLSMVTLQAPPRPGDGPGSGPGGAVTDEDRAFLERLQRWQAQEQAYFQLQSTKPQSLAYGLVDSPVGLAAWIAEKWRAWSDCRGRPETAIARDDLVATIALYWFTATIGSSSRLYYESRAERVRLRPGERIEVPTGFLLEAPIELADDPERSFLGVARVGAPPRAGPERTFDVRRWTEADHGGHFPALETPELLVDELRAFFRPLRAH